MDMCKELIRKRIKEKFKTIENFSKCVDIPRTTINFILKNGVSSSNYGMVSKILKKLDIYTADDFPISVDSELLNLLKIYSALDDVGKHTVSSVAQTEYRRVCPESFKDALVAAYGSISKGSPFSDEEKDVLDLVERINRQNQ